MQEFGRPFVAPKCDHCGLITRFYHEPDLRVLKLPKRPNPVEDEDVDVRSGRAGGLCLAVRPDAEHRVIGAGIELGEDRDAHSGRRV